MRKFNLVKIIRSANLKLKKLSYNFDKKYMYHFIKFLLFNFFHEIYSNLLRIYGLTHDILNDFSCSFRSNLFELLKKYFINQLLIKFMHFSYCPFTSFSKHSLRPSSTKLRYFSPSVINIDLYHTTISNSVRDNL